MKNKKTQKPKKFRVSKNGSSFFRNTHRVVIDGISISTQKLFDTRKKNGVMLAVDFTEKVLPLFQRDFNQEKTNYCTVILLIVYGRVHYCRVGPRNDFLC